MNELQNIYTQTLKENFNIKSGYLVSFKPLEGKHSFVSVDTMFINHDGKFEVRRPGLLNAVGTKTHFNFLNIPLGIISEVRELNSFLLIGGHAVISHDIISRHWKELLIPKKVALMPNDSYIDYEVIDEKYKKRFAKGELRMRVFKRDNYQCRICGSSPDDNIHVRLEVHHIKPWSQGGLSDLNNLITLCSICHEGAETINREVLYKKIGLKFPDIEHEMFDLNLNWSLEQQRIYGHLLSNAVLLKVTNKNQTLK